jgi:3-hydroxyisobutyrate dehydrogenase-like beta-hydroxyacid dehydrogenase
MKIGFIGAGLMGSGMIRNLAAAGHDVSVYARTASKAQGLPARLASSVRDAVDGADLACSIVTDSPDVRQVVEALLATDAPPPILLEMSTIAPAVALELAPECAARGVAYCDCPVSGGPAGADAGTLAIMCGGDADALAHAAAALDAMGDPAKRHHLGPVGSGLVAKLVNNMLAATITAATAEALGVGQRAGVDADALRRVVLSSSGSSWQLENRFEQWLGGDFRPGFRTRDMRKDLGHARSLAARPLALTDVTADLFADVDGALDYGAVAQPLMDISAPPRSAD